MRKFAIGGVLLVAATHCAALTLGGTQGTAIIGRPFDVLVKTQMDSGEAAAGLCLEAELLYGDTRIAPSAVTVAIHKLAEDGTGTLRVRASVPVNEPVVTLVMKSGCTAKYTRSYAVLADIEPQPSADARAAVPKVQEGQGSTRIMPVAIAGAEPARAIPKSAPAPAEPRADKPRAAVAPRVVPAASDAADETTPSPVRLPPPAKRPAGVNPFGAKVKPGAGAAESTASTAAPAPDRSGKAAASSGTAVPAPAAPTPAAPRLKLDPVEVPLGTASGSGPETGALPAPPEATPLSPEEQKFQAMQKELQGLRSEQARLRATMEAVNAQLNQAQGERYSNPLVYGLLGLSVAALAGLGGMVWRRRNPAAGSAKSVHPWWRLKGSEGSPTANAVAPTPESPEESVPHARSPLEALTQLGRSVLDGLEVHESSPESMLVMPERVHIAFDDLADLMQQVDFFVSLGQHADALQTLDAFLEQYPSATELPYLLRLRVCADLADAAGLETTERMYLRHFSHPVPSPLDYGPTAPGLEQDKIWLDRLSAVWPNQQARQLIESGMVTHAEENGALRVRSLEAFYDLMFLHGMLDAVAALPPVVTGNPVPAESERPPLPPAWMNAPELSVASAVLPAADFTLPPASNPSVGLDLPVLEAVAPPVASNPAAHEPAAVLDIDLTDFSAPVPASPPLALEPVLEELPVLDLSFADESPAPAPAVAAVNPLPQVEAAPAQVSEPEASPAPAASRELPSLDFEFLDFGSLKKSAETDKKAE